MIHRKKNCEALYIRTKGPQTQVETAAVGKWHQQIITTPNEMAQYTDASREGSGGFCKEGEQHRSTGDCRTGAAPCKTSWRVVGRSLVHGNGGGFSANGAHALETAPRAPQFHIRTLALGNVYATLLDFGCRRNPLASQTQAARIVVAAERKGEGMLLRVANGAVSLEVHTTTKEHSQSEASRAKTRQCQGFCCQNEK